MNYWTEISIELANQRNYLDLLFSVYPMIPEDIREIDKEKWALVESSFNKKDNQKLLRSLLNLNLFPIKDSYVAYLRKDRSSILRNPETVDRLCGRFYSMGLNEIFEKVSSPKETNRQIGPFFKRWVAKGVLGIPMLPLESFSNTNENAILLGSDADLKHYATQHLGYTGTKGLDLLLRIHQQYVIAEAKFLTDYGGHQNAQFEDAKNLLLDTSANAIHIAILDGVLYIPGRNKLFRYISSENSDRLIMSSLVLSDFIFQV